MKTPSSLIPALATAIGLALTAPGTAPSVNAADAQRRQTDAVGVSSGQTLRLNLFNRGDERGIFVNWRFLDAEGALVAASERPIAVGLSKVVSIDLNRDAIPRAGNRHQLRAEVNAIGDPNLRNLRVTLEVFDNATGKTTVFVDDPED
ncbi:MAG TPA: hypothetical protein VF511_06345 [Chthoniobacterales bacterium]